MANEKEQKEKKFGDYIQFTPDTGGGKKLDPKSQEAKGVVLFRDGQDDAAWEDMIDRAEKQGKLGKVKFTKKDGTKVYNEGPPPADKETAEAMDAITAGRRPLSKAQQEVDKKSMLDTGMRARHPQPSTRQIEAENATENWDSWTNKPKTSPGLAPVKYAPPGESFEDMQVRGAAERKSMVDERLAGQTELETSGQIAPGPAGVPLPSREEQAATQAMALKHAPTTPIGPGQPEGSGLMDFMGAVATANSLNPFATEAPQPRESQGAPPEMLAAPQEPTQGQLAMQMASQLKDPGGVSLAPTDLTKLREQQNNLTEFTKKSQADTEASLKKHDEFQQLQRNMAAAEQQKAIQDQQAAIDIQQETKTKIQKDMGLRTQYLADAERAAATEVDPSRFWARKDVGQKAMAVIAGALFGFTGQGMDWLKRLDSLVAEDMRAQEGDRDSKVKGLQARASGISAEIAELRAMGLDEAQARQMMADRRLQVAKSYMDQITLSAQNEQLKLTAQQNAAILAGKLAEGEQAMAQLSQAGAMNAARVKLENLKLQQDFMFEKAKLVGSVGGKPKKALSPAQTAEINNVKTGYNAVQKALTIVGKDGYIMRNLKQLGNDGMSSDGELYAKLRSHLTEVVAQLDKAGALSKDELKFFSSQVAKQGDFNAKETLTQLKGLLADKYNTYVKDYGNSYDMEGFDELQTEEADAARLESGKRQ